jgi:anion-transporting  ArsA/GET3 family ATPase
LLLCAAGLLHRTAATTADSYDSLQGTSSSSSSSSSSASTSSSSASSSAELKALLSTIDLKESASAEAAAASDSAPAKVQQQQQQQQQLQAQQLQVQQLQVQQQQEPVLSAARVEQLTKELPPEFRSVVVLRYMYNLALTCTLRETVVVQQLTVGATLCRGLACAEIAVTV